MTPVIVLLAVAVLAAGAWSLRERGRRKRLARLREDWGRPIPPASFDDHDAAEAWRESGSAIGAGEGLNDRTWADLDLDRVLATLDRTHTTFGRQRLYWRMRSGESWTATPSLEALAQHFSRDVALREAVGQQLVVSGRSLGRGFWGITRPYLLHTRWWYWSFPVLALAMLACLVVVPFDPRAIVVAIIVAVINVTARMATAWQIPGLLAPMRQIGPLIALAEGLSRNLAHISPEARDVAATIRQLARIRRVARWVSRDPVAVGELLTGLWEYLNLLFILDANALVFSAKYLRRDAPLLGDLAKWVGDLDVAWSVASLRAEPRDWCLPGQPALAEVRGEGVWHPLVPSPVPNDIRLVPGHGLIVTGANMSGKSTYLRSVGIAAVLARAINSAPATKWEGRTHQVRSLIGRADDLSAGKSYYQVEADGVVSLLRVAGGTMPTIFLLDELLRGTNTVERLAAGEAILRAILAGDAGLSSHTVIVATHDGELVAMLADRYAAVHFRETISQEGLTFDYRRREGPATTRTAIALLEATGAPPEVIAMARARADQLDAAAREPSA